MVARDPLDVELPPPRRGTQNTCRDARGVSDVAAELGCDWRTISKAVLAWREALLAADVKRVGSVEALRLDETLFGREDPPRHE